MTIKLEPATLVEVVNQKAGNKAANNALYNFIGDDGALSSSLTYIELKRKAETLAKVILSKTAPGQRALLMYSPGVSFIIAFYGCLMAGVIAIPTYPPRKNQNLQRLKNIINDADVSVVLSDDLVLGVAQAKFAADENLAKIAWINTEEYPTNIELMNISLPVVTRDNIALFQYTSGSTGNPKGVVITHKNIISNQSVIASIACHSENSVGVSWLPHFHDMGLFYSVIQPLFVGFPMYIMSPAYFSQKPIRWLEAIYKYRATTSCAPNFAYDLCIDTLKNIDEIDFDLSCLQTSFNSAEPISPTTIDRFQKTFGPFGYSGAAHKPCYGMAEMTLLGACTRRNSHNRLVLSAKQFLRGKAIDCTNEERSYVVVSSGVSAHGHSIAIVDPDKKTLCVDNQVGEIWFKGDSVAAGYWNREKETKECFQAYIANTDHGPYLRTGDLGFLRNGEVYVTGRRKDTMIFRGQNYYPQDIEAIASRGKECVNNGAAAFSISVAGEEKLVLVQEIKRTSIRNKNLDLVALRIKKSITEEFGLQIHDIVFVKVNRLLKTSSGKIQRQENRQTYINGETESIYQLSSTADRNEQKYISPPKDDVGPISATDSSNSIVKTQKLNTIKHWLRKRISEFVNIREATISFDVEFAQLGMDSILGMRLIGDFNDEFNISLSATHIYDYPTIHLFATAAISDIFSSDFPDNPPIVSQCNKIAVIGMSCRFPKSDNITEYWNLIRNSEEGVGAPPAERVELEGSSYKAGYLKCVSDFDAELFSISPKEARLMDPQQRILLEQVFEALLSAGYNHRQLAGSRTGVFVGVTSNDYSALCLTENAHTSPYFVTGNAPSITANRISYYFDFKGPSFAIDTACSSSLVAVTRAVQSLRNGECDLAIVAGVQLNLLPQISESLASANMLSPDGHCKVFDASANGYVRGEGCGVIILKPAKNAAESNNKIFALISGVAVVQDGRTNGLSAPNGLSQQQVIQRALHDANVSADQIDYVEAHGTGTELGDPIELQALQAVYGAASNRQHPLKVGSVKANIGHLEAAAGMAGLIKLILCFHHQVIPKQRHFVTPNPHIDWGATNISVPRHAIEWPKLKQQRYGAISSFGFGGTNAHLILQDEPYVTTPPEQAGLLPPSYGVFTFSAHNGRAIQNLMVRINQKVSSLPNDDLWNFAYTSAVGWSHLKLRKAVFFADQKELRKLLSNGIDTLDNLAPCTPPSQLTFIFTGQGSQYPKMGKMFYEVYPVFKAGMDRCDALLKPLLGYSILALLYGNTASTPNGLTLDDTGNTQPAIFCVEYALAQLWMSWGIIPTAVLGHSVGEIVAATIAGIFDLEDALKFIAARATLSQSVSCGCMVNVYTNSVSLIPYLEPYGDGLSIAAINTPDTCVVSGEENAIKKLITVLTSQGIETKKLQVSHAFHSPMMEPIKTSLDTLLSSVRLQPPKLPFIDNLHSEINHPAVCTSEYWLNHLTGTVRFADSLNVAGEQGCRHFLEVGPAPHLCGLAIQTDRRSDSVYLASLTPKENPGTSAAKTLARLYDDGFDIDWEAYYAPFAKRKITLPDYPFQRNSFWVPTQVQAATSAAPFVTAPAVSSFTNTTSMAASPSIETKLSTGMSREGLLNILKGLLADSLQADEASIDADTPLLEIGADSLIILEFARKIEAKYHLNFAISQFFEELSTLRKLSEYIVLNGATDESIVCVETAESNSPNTTARPSTPPPNSAEMRAVVPLSTESMMQVMQSQLLFASQTQTDQARLTLHDICALQLDYFTRLDSTSLLTPNPTLRGDPPAIGQPNKTRNGQTVAVVPALRAESKSSSLPPWRPATDNFSAYGAEQKRHLQVLTESHNRRTRKSKALTQQYRASCADSRASAGFRLSTKEMLYPIYGDRALGARTWDIDGNEYIDITMGFGVNLFGHQPVFVIEAVQEQLEKSMQLGLQTSLSGQVAELICELTGMSRVTFCNSGTEAVMTALRLCRAVTKRNKVVQFIGSYHGHYDGTLAEAASSSAISVPMAPGVNRGAVEDVILLEYGSDDALAEIALQAGEIAAVLVEPVQSRYPELQPTEFLRALRTLTVENGILLIFDEMITGFRILPGGAQQWFDVQADIATYGKIVGGGLPIGVVAGRHNIMDGIDGGAWQYGDDSHPRAETTFFAGTFCKHPLTMAAAHAVLKTIRDRGVQMYYDLNHKTLQLACRLNSFFLEKEMPLEIVQFGSLFRFKFKSNLDVLFYNLMQRGLYVWEGRNCFLSIAHTDEDIEDIYVIITESLQVMQDDGFFPSKASLTNTTKSLARATCESTANAQTVASYFSVASEPKSRFPLYDAQKQLWAADHLDDEGGLAYHLPLTVKLDGTLRLDMLKQAILKLLDRHPALRTCFSDTGEEQFYQPTPTHFELRELNLVDVSESQRAAKMRAFLEEENCRPFKLTQDLLLRVSLITQSASEFLLMLRTHHIVADGLSLSILLNELAEVYSALVNRKIMNLPQAMELSCYAQLHTQFTQSAEFSRQETFWSNIFSTGVPQVELPTDYPIKASQFSGQCVTFSLPATTISHAYEFANKHQCTLFMALVAVYTLWLHKVTGQERIIVGFPAAGRGISDRGDDTIHSLVAYCTHVVPLLSELRADEALSQFVSRIRQSLLRAYENQDYPYAKLLKLLQPGQDLSRRRLINCVINLDVIKDHPEFSGLQLSFGEKSVDYVDFDLSFNFIDSTTQSKGLIGGNLKLEVEYRRSAFSDTSVQRFFQQYCTLFEQCASYPDSPVTDYRLLDTQQQRIQCDNWDAMQGERAVSDCFIKRLECGAESHPKRIALRMADRSLNYGEMNHQANWIAKSLWEQGICTGSRVAVYLSKSIEQITAVLGILKTGAAYVPVDAALVQERVRYILNDSAADFIISTQSLLHDVGSSLPYLSVEKMIYDGESENLVLERDGENPAYVIYTSGSTGNPKGVVVPYANLMRRYYAWNRCFGLEEIVDPVHLQMANFSFDVFTGDLIRALGSGATMLLVSKNDLLDTAHLCQIIEDNQVNFAEFVPAIAMSLTECCERSQKTLNNLEVFIVGSDSWYINNARRIKEILPASTRLFNTYGVTEATIDSSYCELTDELLSALPEHMMVPIGKPMNNVCMFIVDQDFNIQPQGVAGELLIGGDSLATGYWGNETLSKEKFVSDSVTGNVLQRLYRTGDQAKYRDGGFIEFIGRLDHQVKIRGYRVELGEVEFAVRKLDGVLQAAVISRDDNGGKKQLLAFVEGNPSKLQPEQTMLAELKCVLPEYMLPTSIVVLENLPLTASGKVDRKNLESIEVNFHVSTVDDTVPVSEQEKILTEIYKDLFRRQKVSTKDNFFALGGDSITAIQLLSRLRQLNFLCKASDVFSNPDIASLAKVITVLAQESDSAAVCEEVITDKFEIQPNPIQAWCYEQCFQNLSHWNQELLLTCHKGISTQHLQQAFNLLVDHHSALKMRFEKSLLGQWTQWHNSASAIVPVHEIEFTGAADKQDVQIEIETFCDSLHAKMRLDKGELVQVAIVRTPEFMATDRLFVSVHHLVLDGVSWRVLMDDLQRAVQALRSGRNDFFGYKTTHFSEYSLRLNQFANSAECLQDLAYWQGVVNQSSASLPCDFIVDTTYEKDSKSVTATLGRQATSDLLQRSNKAYHTEIDELLLSAMGLALANWTGGECFKISLEGHGRDTFYSPIDISHTIGWFTSIYPVLVQVSQEHCLDFKKNLAQIIEATKHSLRSVPKSGFTYSPIRYLSQDEKVRSSLQYTNMVEFNYLGQTDNMNIEQMGLGLSIVDDILGKTRAAENHRTNDLEIDLIVVNDEMKIRIAFSCARYENSTMQALANHFISYLDDIVDHCLQVNNQWHVREYPLVNLSQDAFCALVTRLNDIDDIQDIYPQSALQSGMLFHSINDQEGSTYIDQLYCEFFSAVDESKFQQAWQQLVDTHSIFRTEFVFEGLSQGLQVVRSRVRAPLEIIDARGEDSADVYFEQMVKTERSKHLTYTSPSLMRLMLYRLDESHYGFVWTFHHAVMDGWSLANALEHFTSTYQALVGGALAPVFKKDEYVDYIAYLQGYDQVKANVFWTEYLRDFETPTKLRENPDSTLPTEIIGETILSIDRQLFRNIIHFAQAQQVTLNTIMQAAWLLVLHTHTQSDDIVLGVTCTGRPAELDHVEDRVGLYINTIPLRVKFDQSISCRDWLKSLHKNQLDVLDYQYSSLLDIQKCSKIGADNPLLNILLVCENYPIGATGEGDNGSSLAIQNIHAPEHTNFPISLEVAMEENGLKLKLTYQTKLFGKAFTQQLLNHIVRAFIELTNDCDRTLDQLQLVDPSETQYLLHELNQSKRNYDLSTSWVNRFQKQAKQTPNAVAMVHGDSILNYAQLNRLANGFARVLQDKGVGIGDVIPVIAASGFLPPVAFLAINKCGAAFAPLDARWPRQRLMEVLADINAKCVLLDTRLNLDLQIVDNIYIVAIDDIEEQTENPGVEISPDLPIYVIHTSGSTGKPKGAVNCHKGILNRFLFMDEYFGVPSQDTILQTTHHCYDSAVWQYFWPLLSGGKSVLQNWEQGIDLFQIIDMVQRHQVTISDFTPGVLASLIAHLKDMPEHREQLSSLRALLLGGDALSTKVVRDIRKLFPHVRLNNCYGPSETSIGVVFYEIPACVPDILPIGRPIANVKAYVLNARGQTLPSGVVGELYLGGSCIGLGYLNNPEATAGAFVANRFDEEGGQLYRTGDLVRYLADGNIEFIGRRDNQVKIRGHRVELGDVEVSISKLPDVHSCCVQLYKDAQKENQIAAFVVTKNKNLSVAALHRNLRESLPRFMHPANLQLVPELPVTFAGKIDKKYLIETLKNKDNNIFVDRHASNEAPRTPLECQLCEIFQNVLKLDQIDIHTGFFDVGGHSLSATQVVSLGRKHLGIEMNVKDLFMHASVAQLAEVLESRRSLDPAFDASAEAVDSRVTTFDESAPDEIEI